MTKRDDDESHILSDGERVRVPLMMKDSWQRDMHERFQRRTQLHDGRGNSVGHRPGFVVSDASNHTERVQAYADCERDLVAAYKTDPRNGRLTRVPDTRDVVTMDEILAQYVRELRNG
jgi:hypothetical protein